MIKHIFAILLIFTGSFSWAQSKNKVTTSPLQRADVISVKAALEDMIVRRYAQELSAIVSYDRFNVGARFELDIIESKDSKRNVANDSQYTDLELGYLDADTLFDRYSNVDAGTVSPLAKYSIKSVAINVGLQENMGEQIKKTVDEWLQARVKEEFGSVGKAQVQFIQSEKSNPTMLDRVIQMQGLFGQLILALAILLGVILWRILGGGSAKKEKGSSSEINIQSKTELAGLDDRNESASSVNATQDLAIENKIEQLSAQVKELAPRLVDQLEELMNQWSEQGENGLLRIACFAEISGSIIGSLPIPKSHKKQMGDVFAKMSKLSLENRFDIVNSVYWDLIASLNLGTETLSRPFSFLGNSNVGTINEALLGNDLDMQTVVSLYMPDNVRKNYFAKLDNDKKVELLNTAAKLSSISHEKLKSIETKIQPYFQEKVDDTDVSLSMTLNKLIDSMSFIDACQLMPKVKGPMVNFYKTKNPHLCFLQDWTIAAQETLIKKASNEELLAYLRVVPVMKAEVLELISPRAKQILVDDLGREDSLPESEKEKRLESLHNRLINLILSNTIILEDAIKPQEKTEGLSVAA